MSEFHTDQYKKTYVDKPAQFIFPHEYNGRIRRIYAHKTLDAELTTNDALFVVKLPKNAVIKSARLVGEAGTGGVIQLGWAASQSGQEVAVAAGLFGAVSSAAAIDELMDIGAKSVAFNKRFAAEVDIVLTATTNTTGMSGKLVEVELEFVVD